MREAVMSPGLFVARTTEPEFVLPVHGGLKRVEGWNTEDFAREQIRGLVRRVFFSKVERPVRQVVFSPVEPETDVLNLCWRIGEALALETGESIAVVGEYPPQALEDAEPNVAGMTEHFEEENTGLRRTATRVRGNLWLVPPAAKEGNHITNTLLHSYMGGIRTQFEYSIVEGPSAAESNAATAMAQLADGIVLVLSAQHTRRITARKVKEQLESAQACLLGTVLSDRAFPIPERIYRRL
jgi:hypothetical protein